MEPGRRSIYIYELSRRVGEILHYIWDPIGVRGAPRARDEYDNYVSPILELLEGGATETELSACLTEIATEAMGLTRGPKGSSDDLEISKLLIEHYKILKKQYEE